VGEESAVGRGAYVLARVAVMVRVPARWLWWSGVLAALAGAFVPGLVAWWIGLAVGAGLFVVAALFAALTRRKRYRTFAAAAPRAAKNALLQDRHVTRRIWLRSRRWWLLAAFVVALGSSAAAPAAGGMLLAGLGAGLWFKARSLGRWERRHEQLLWVRPEWTARGPVGKEVRGYQTTGPAAGDAAPGGVGRRYAVAAH
jgi:hypothetical protein